MEYTRLTLNMRRAKMVKSSLRYLDMAYQKFFKEYTGYPKFK